MEVKIQKWGNSLAVRLPKAFADQIGIVYGSKIRLLVEDKTIKITPVNEDKELLLNEYLSQINKDNIHKEINFGERIGKEKL